MTKTIKIMRVSYPDIHIPDAVYTLRSGSQTESRKEYNR